MDNKKFAKQLEALSRGELDLGSEDGRALLRYAEDSLKELRDTVEALVDGNLCMAKRIKALKVMNAALQASATKPKHLEIRWKDGSVSKINADGYEILAVGDREELTPYRVERIYQEGIPFAGEWSSLGWRDGRAEERESGGTDRCLTRSNYCRRGR